MENDTETGGEELSIDEAANAYANLTDKEVQEDQTETEQADEGDTTDEELQASEEDAGEDSDGETDEEDQAEDDEAEPESEQGRFVADNAKVRLGDGSVTTIAELKKGSLLQADYTRKTQEVAEQRRSVESQSQRISEAEKQLKERFDYAEALLKSFVPQPPDPSLLNTDPVGYMQQKAQFDQLNQHLNYIAQTRQQDAQKAEEEERQGRTKKANEEWDALLGKAPEFKDNNRTKAFLNDIQTHGTAYGFTMQELQQALPMDHRQALVLRDAIAWRKLQASKANVTKKVEGRPPVQRGGKRLSPNGQRAKQATDAFARLKQTGSVEDAAAAYLARQKG